MTTDEAAIAINAIREAVLNIEKELGILPKGMYADLRTRVDILESRINSPDDTPVVLENPLFIGNTGVVIEAGTGAPTSVRNNGSIYLNTDGYQVDSIYLRQQGVWAPILSVDGYVYRNTTTTNNTQSVATTYTTPLNKTIKAEIEILSRDSDGLSGYWKLIALFSNNSNTVTQVGSTNVLTLSNNNNFAASLDTSGANFRVLITGDPSKTTTWSIRGSILIL